MTPKIHIVWRLLRLVGIGPPGLLKRECRGLQPNRRMEVRKLMRKMFNAWASNSDLVLVGREVLQEFDGLTRYHGTPRGPS